MVICQSALLAEGIKFRVIDNDKNLRIKGKEGELIQVFFNLIMNSVHEVAKTKDSFIEISCEKEGNERVKISVTDSGKGLPPEVIERLFEPFFVASGASDALGMGLPLSKDLVEKNGGKLYFNDKAANTQFVIILPIWK